MGFEPHLHRELGTEVCELRTEDPLKIGFGMNHYFALTLAQSQSGYQAHEPQTMVGMEVRDKYMAYFGLLDVPLQEAALRTFPAIDQKLITSEIDHLRGRQVP